MSLQWRWPSPGAAPRRAEGGSRPAAPTPRDAPSPGLPQGSGAPEPGREVRAAPCSQVPPPARLRGHTHLRNGARPQPTACRCPGEIAGWGLRGLPALGPSRSCALDASLPFGVAKSGPTLIPSPSWSLLLRGA